MTEWPLVMGVVWPFLNIFLKFHLLEYFIFQNNDIVDIAAWLLNTVTPNRQLTTSLSEKRGRMTQQSQFDCFDCLIPLMIPISLHAASLSPRSGLAMPSPPAWLGREGRKIKASAEQQCGGTAEHPSLQPPSLCSGNGCFYSRAASHSATPALLLSSLFW